MILEKMLLKGPCYSYDARTNVWSEDGTKTRRTAFGAHALLMSNGSWILTGGVGMKVDNGYYDFKDAIDISEAWMDFSPNSHSLTCTYNSQEPGADFEFSGLRLPMPLAFHCAAEINCTHVFVSGGRTDGGTNTEKAFFFDLATGEATNVDAMASARAGHACAPVKPTLGLVRLAEFGKK